LDTADTFTFDGGDSNVTVFTPFWSPRVLDDIVFNFLSVDLLGSVTNSGDGVVMNNTALSVGNDSTGVSMEDWFVSLDRNVNGSDVKGSFKLLNGINFDVLVAGY
jgi:hypothetical protein